jgi:hypothetical protein
MTLANMVRRKLSETSPADGRHDFAVTDAASGWTLYLTADRRDAWTTVAWEMTLRRAASAGDVAAWAERSAGQVSGLLESLRVVEVDLPHGKALLRSGPPAEGDGAISYYEIVLQATSSALVRRYQGTHASGKREQVPFVLTNDVLAKFVGDLAAE